MGRGEADTEDEATEAAPPRRGLFVSALMAAILLPLLAALLGLPPFQGTDDAAAPTDPDEDAAADDLGHEPDDGDDGDAADPGELGSGSRSAAGGDQQVSADDAWPIEHVLRITLCDDVACPLEDHHVEELDDVLTGDPDVLGHVYLDAELTYDWLTAELQGLASRIDAERIAGMFHVTLLIGADPVSARGRYVDLPGVGDVTWITEGLTPQAQVAERERLGFDEDSRRIAIHLCDGGECPTITEQQRRALDAALADDPDVVDVTRDSVEEAFERFVERFADDPEAADGIDPGSVARPLRLTIDDGADAMAVVERYRDAHGVADVVWERGERD